MEKTFTALWMCRNEGKTHKALINIITAALMEDACKIIIKVRGSDVETEKAKALHLLHALVHCRQYMSVSAWSEVELLIDEEDLDKIKDIEHEKKKEESVP